MTDSPPKLRYIPIEQLKLWEEANVRKSDVLVNIDDLAGNIKENGLQVPLLVKEKEPNKLYLVFSGQRRLQACKMAELEKVACFVFEKISLVDAQIISFSENLYRESMTIDDKSNAANELYKKFKDLGKVALSLGVKEPTVKSYLDYNAIFPELRAMVGKGKGMISAQQARDIYEKFSDLKMALAAARELASIKDRERKRKFHAAIKESTPSDDVSTIRKRADKLIHMKAYEILLPDSKYKTVEKVAYQRKVSAEDILIGVVEDWVNTIERGGQI